jgi:hypothetical protein
LKAFLQRTVWLMGVGLLGISSNAAADINAASTTVGQHNAARAVAPLPQTSARKIHIFRHLNVDGNIRSYYYDREFSRTTTHDQTAFSLGGKINVLTDPFLNGFQVGGTMYFAQPLGLDSKNHAFVDRSLPGSPITTLGQAFLQYQNTYILGRIGNQEVTTPWLNESDSRMIPSTYQGIKADLTPFQNVTLTGMRLIRFKSRVSRLFTQTNLYNPENLGTPLAALGNKTDIGSLAFAAIFKYKTLHMQIWDYRFYNYSNLAYADVNYEWETKKWLSPLCGAQIAKEWGDGSNVLKSIGLGKTRGSVFGAVLGAEMADGKIAVSYNYLPRHAGAYQNGDIISPYTSGYESDPLYTTSMNAGIIEKAAGSAVKLTLQYSFFNKQLQLLASYAKYNTKPYKPNTDESDFDAMYSPEGIFKNLSIRYRLGFLNGNPTPGRIAYNRLMLQYNF